MTLVDQATGEIIEPLDERGARELTERIKSSAEGLFDLAVEAYHGQVWIALGYESWDDYLTNELGNVRLKLPREDRAEQVASLREQGLSLRAIASVTGTSEGTVRNDLSGAQNYAPEPKPVQGVDGKTYTRKPKPSQPKTYRCSTCGKAGFEKPVRHCDECGTHYSDPTCPNDCDRRAAERQTRLSRVYSSLEYLSQINTDPSTLLDEVPEGQWFRIANYIDDAKRWLDALRAEYEKRLGTSFLPDERTEPSNQGGA